MTGSTRAWDGFSGLFVESHPRVTVLRQGDMRAYEQLLER